MLDLEHTGWGIEGIRPLLAAAAAHDVEPLVRVQGSARQLISPALDVGARGVMVPMIGDAIEAERVVQAARFAPARQPRVRAALRRSARGGRGRGDARRRGAERS